MKKKWVFKKIEYFVYYIQSLIYYLSKMNKVFHSNIINTINNFGGQIINDVDTKKIFGANASSVDTVFKHNNKIFLIVSKWDNGVMSTNNVNQFLKSCNHIISEVAAKEPSNNYEYYKVIISKKTINYNDFTDLHGKPKLYNFTLNECDQNQIIPEMFEYTLMENLCMRFYNFVSSTLNYYPGLMESDGDVKMSYSY